MSENLVTKDEMEERLNFDEGTMGSTSLFVMLGEADRSGVFESGDRILTMVPESGRFIFGFGQLTCVG